jgi:hypothetical protein
LQRDECGPDTGSSNCLGAAAGTGRARHAGIANANIHLFDEYIGDDEA